MVVSYVILFATLLAGSLGSEVDTRADQDYPFRNDYSFSEQANGWLKLHRVPSKWNDAKLRCMAEGGVLASPLNANLKHAILKLVSGEIADTIFIGVNAALSAGSYASIEGVPLSLLPVTWTSGEPKSIRTNCLTMKSKGGTIGTVECSDSLPYVCYRPRTDDHTITECGTYDRAYNLDSRTGSCYKFHLRSLNWHQAYMTCDSEGGYLAIINSNIESDILYTIFASIPNSEISGVTDAHIGFYDMRDGGSWMTIHGQTLDEAGFSEWSGLTNPDNFTLYSPEGEACGSIARYTGQLNDVWCGMTIPFFCEKNPTSLQTILN